MAVLNPLEKKARSSFIKGLLIAGFIGILAVSFLALIIFKKNGEEKERLAAQKPVVIITQDIKSGDEITEDMLNTELANPEVATAGSITLSDFSEYSSIFDDDGNLIGFNRIIAKIDIPAKSILSQDMIAIEDEKITSDLREQEYNMIVPYATLEDGDTIDIRLRLPSGVDYIVISKKKVSLINLGDTFSTESISLKLSEGELLTMSSAIVDAYQITGSKLYAIKYTDPGLQKAATATYVPNLETTHLIEKNPNIVNEAKRELIERYNATYVENRQGVDSALQAVEDDERQSKIESGTGSEISTQEAERKTYLDSLYGAE